MGVNDWEWVTEPNNNGPEGIENGTWVALLQLMRPVGRCVGCGKPIYRNHVVNGMYQLHAHCLSFLRDIGEIEEVEA